MDMTGGGAESRGAGGVVSVPAGATALVSGEFWFAVWPPPRMKTTPAMARTSRRAPAATAIPVSELRRDLAARLTVGVGDMTGAGAETRDGITGSAGAESDTLTGGMPCGTPGPGIGARSGRPWACGGGSVSWVAGIGRTVGVGADNDAGVALDGVTDGITTTGTGGGGAAAIADRAGETSLAGPGDVTRRSSATKSAPV